MASKNIKGITIEIGGNTSKLEESLKSVNKTIYSTNNELRDLNKALKLDPKNTELLSQKQEVLKNNINATKEKLNQLKTAQQQMGNYSNLTDEQKEKYRALSVEISKSESALKNMNNELKSTKTIDLSGLKDGLKKVGDVALDVAKKVGEIALGVGAAIGAIMTKAVKSYAELEQNVGGVETLFKDNAQAVIDNANKAYKTAGVSANEYMQGVTSFAASLLQSTAGNTAEAAKVADMAFIDMSDNANKFGTDMASIQHAYQGFAKQNYTMLDNLKLGYGGTKTEMERLLSDAEKLTGIHYDINELDDVYNAIHAIQVNLDVSGYSTEQLSQKLKDMSLTEEELTKVANSMGISYDEAFKKMKEGALTTEDAQVLLGTTAKEALTTISGSLNAMKAAFDNFLNGSGSVKELADSVTIFMKNVAKAVVEMAPDLLNGIGTLVSTLLPQVISLIVSIAPQLIDTAFTLMQTIVDAVVNNVQPLIQLALKLVNNIVNFILKNLPMILKAGIEIIVELVKGISQSLPELIPAMVDALLVMVETLIDNLDMIIDAAITLIIALAEGLIAALPKLIEKIPIIIDKLVTKLTDPEMLGKLIQAAARLITELAIGLVMAIPDLLKGVVKINDSIINGLKNILVSIPQIGSNIAKGIWDGISNSLSWIKSKIKSWVGNVTSFIKKLFGIHSPSTLMRDEIGENLGLGIAEGILDTQRDVNEAMSQLSSGIEASVNPTINPTANTNPLIIQIDKFINNRDSDIQELAEQLEFYRKNSALVKGGA